MDLENWMDMLDWYCFSVSCLLFFLKKNYSISDADLVGRDAKNSVLSLSLLPHAAWGCSPMLFCHLVQEGFTQGFSTLFFPFEQVYISKYCKICWLKTMAVVDVEDYWNIKQTETALWFRHWAETSMLLLKLIYDWLICFVILIKIDLPYFLVLH